MTLDRRRGFTLLEVIVALAILTISLLILVETQATAVKMTQDAERFITATTLAQEKYTEAAIRMEEEGFYEGQEIEENGDFDDFGDEGMDLEFGERLEDYHWRYSILEIDLGLAPDIMGMASEYGDSMAPPGLADGASGAAGAAGGAGAGGLPPGMESFLNPESMSEYLAKYIRQVEVEVWWGDADLDVARKKKNVVLLTGHISNPTGALTEAPDITN